jgi:hemoglobin
MVSEEMNGTTLYQRIGGEAAIHAAVDRFYERVLADPALSHFFTEVSMSRLKAHQFAFLSQALGGPKQYSGASMRDAHSKLAIEQRHFDSVAVHLVETLRELGVPEDIIGEIAAAVTPLSGQIVNTPTQAAIA